MLSAIIEFQWDKINYVPWQCLFFAKLFPSCIYKTECFEKPRDQRAHLIYRYIVSGGLAHRVKVPGGSVVVL
jgi:hypothetical protein